VVFHIQKCLYGFLMLTVSSQHTAKLEACFQFRVPNGRHQCISPSLSKNKAQLFWVQVLSTRINTAYIYAERTPTMCKRVCRSLSEVGASEVSFKSMQEVAIQIYYLWVIITMMSCKVGNYCEHYSLLFGVLLFYSPLKLHRKVKISFLLLYSRSWPS